MTIRILYDGDDLYKMLLFQQRLITLQTYV